MNIQESGRAEWIATRETLLSRVKNWEDRESWLEFFGIYKPLVYHEARRRGLSEAEAEDVVQETMLSVAKAMPNFQYRREKGSFKSWLLNLTRWRVRDCLRKRVHGTATAEAPPEWETSLEQLPDTTCKAPDETWDKEWREGVLREAMKKVRRTVDARNYQAFHCFVVYGWDPKDIAGFLRMPREGVYKAKERVGKAIRREIEQMGVKWE